MSARPRFPRLAPCGTVGEQSITRTTSRSDFNVLWRAARVHAARRRRFDYAISTDAAAMKSALPARCRAAPVRMVKCRTVDAYTLAPTPNWCSKAISTRAIAVSKPSRRRTPASRVATHFHPRWAGYMGKAYKAPTFHVTAVTMRKPETKPIIFGSAFIYPRPTKYRHHCARGAIFSCASVAARHRAGRGHPTA